jgi:hypothetical protein
MKYADCIQACLTCYADCRHCLAMMATKESMNDCPRCCVECSSACLACVDSMTADSRWASRYCGICAEICDWCAEQCEAHDHEHCQQCAKSCRACAEQCRKMAA